MACPCFPRAKEVGRDPYSTGRQCFPAQQAANPRVTSPRVKPNLDRLGISPLLHWRQRPNDEVLQTFLCKFEVAQDGAGLIQALLVLAGGDRVGHDARPGLQVGDFIFD